MTTETNTQPGSGGTTVPAADAAPTPTVPAPKSDAEAELAAAQEPPKEEPKPAETEAEKERKRNRTKEYIERKNAEVAELRRELAEVKKNLPPPAPKPEPPKPEDFYNDPVGFTQAVAEHARKQALEDLRNEQRQQTEQQKQQETWDRYNQRVASFAEANPDFQEVVSSIRFQVAPEVQAAIAAHESGPAIAYHLGLNEQDAFLLASARPELAGYVIEQIASRLKAAPEPGNAPPPSPPAAPPETTKPITQAPPPAPRVGGRSPTEVPPEKMTDDEWYRQERERARKR